MANKNQHVVPHNDNWAVKGAGNEKVSHCSINTKLTIEMEMKPLKKGNNLLKPYAFYDSFGNMKGLDQYEYIQSS